MEATNFDSFWTWWFLCFIGCSCDCDPFFSLPGACVMFGQGMAISAVTWDAEPILRPLPVLAWRHLHSADKPRLRCQPCESQEFLKHVSYTRNTNRREHFSGICEAHDCVHALYKHAIISCFCFCFALMQLTFLFVWELMASCLPTGAFILFSLCGTYNGDGRVPRPLHRWWFYPPLL